MKRIILLLGLLILVICMLLSCDQKGTYDEGYADGYLEAKVELQYLLEEEFLEGYDIGYEDGRNDSWDDLGSAYEFEGIHYARGYSEWSPEEAWCLIEAYHNNEPFYEDGTMASEDEYLDAINSLIYFYDYFYSAQYAE